MHRRGSIRAVSVLAAVSMALACADRPREPPRPAGLPVEAFWLGGPDGGAFVALKSPVGSPATSYTGSVYYQDGSLWYEGRFVLQPAGGKPIDPANHGQFTAWDGTQILLQDGRSLLAAQPSRIR